MIFTVGGYDTLAKVFDSLQLEIKPATVALMTRDNRPDSEAGWIETSEMA